MVEAHSQTARAALQVRGLSAGTGAQQRFRDLSFAVRRGEAVAMTTLDAADFKSLLAVLAGLERAPAGEILWSGAPGYPARDRATVAERYRLERDFRLRTALVSDSASLISNLTLHDNVALPLRYHLALPEAEVAIRVGSLLKLLELEEMAGRRPAGLSPGMRRRAQLARALVLRPEFLLLETPLADIDAHSAETMVSALEEALKDGNLSLLAATHEPRALLRVVSRILILEEGRLLGSLEGEELEDPELFEDARGLSKLLEKQQQ